MIIIIYVYNYYRQTHKNFKRGQEKKYFYKMNNFKKSKLNMVTTLITPWLSFCMW